MYNDAQMVRAAWSPRISIRIRRLADIFRVSPAATGFRLTNLGLRGARQRWRPGGAICLGTALMVASRQRPASLGPWYVPAAEGDEPEQYQRDGNDC
jgi:hypothetical protein